MCEENCGASNPVTDRVFRANLGTDGATPPVIPGTGVRGWLRSIYDRLVLIYTALTTGIVVTGEVEIKNDTGNPIPISDGGGSITVDGTFFQATQPVSVASLPLPANAAQETGGNLAALVAKDFATQTTLALVKAKTDNLDVALSTRATEATQLLNNTELQAIKTALQIIDDWDESDRAKVNPIVGQSGVQAGAGSVSANTQRVVIATDQTVVPVSGTLPTGAEKNEDAAHASGDSGYLSLGVRNDTRAAKTNADGDYSAYSTDQYGNVLVSVAPGTYNNGAQTTVAGSAVVISAANTANVKVIVQNVGATPMAVGASGVTSTTGFVLNGGGFMIFLIDDGCKNDIYAIRTTAISTTAMAQRIT